MFKQIKNGTKIIVQGVEAPYTCWLPPVGFGCHADTGEIAPTDVIKRSNVAKEQYWEVQHLPKDWDKKIEIEAQKRKDDNDDEYSAPYLDAIREREWNRRLYGVWFYNNGEPTYLTGMHYMLLNYWFFQGKRFDYREPNRDYYYVLQYCIEDPNCLGLIEVTKRKEGKTARAGLFLYEYISRTSAKHGGIQSKTDPDAEEVFDKAVITPWTKLPEFFRPIYDTSKGDRPKKELRFYNTSKRGKNVVKEDNALESFIDFKPATPEAYDGPELHRYVSDEAGKLIKHSILDRHNVVMFCSEVDGKYVGKQLYTTTVEEAESGGGEFKKLVDISDRTKRNENGRTKSGLYIYFLSADRTMYYDKYGKPDVIKGRTWHENQRKALQDDDGGRSLSSYIRKNPFTLSEAFRVDGSSCIYNPDLLNQRRDELSWMENIVERGNFEWKDGIKDGEVEWRKASNGRWLICTGFQFDNPEDRNNIIRHGNILKPGNKSKFVCAADGFDHDITMDDQRRSNAASHILKKHVPGKEDDPYNNAFITEYCYRPQMSSIFYEDMIKQCVYFGCDILPESNKPGIIKYFKQRGYEHFLILLPGYKDVGIPSTTENKKTLAELTEEYIVKNINKVYFIKLIEDWLEFNLLKTQKYDRAMAAGWCLVADSYRTVKKNTGKVADITDYFRMTKVV